MHSRTARWQLPPWKHNAHTAATSLSRAYNAFCHSGWKQTRRCPRVRELRLVAIGYDLEDLSLVLRFLLFPVACQCSSFLFVSVCLSPSLTSSRTVFFLCLFIFYFFIFLSSRYSNLNFYPCVIKFSQSVSQCHGPSLSLSLCVRASVRARARVC